MRFRRGRHSAFPSSSSVAEALRLQVEHRPVAAALRHQLVVRAELDDPAVLEDADAIGLADGREAVRDQDGRAVPRGGQDALEDLRLAAHVELRRRLVEQHDAGAQLHGAERARQRDALPLAARQIGAALVAAGQHGVEPASFAAPAASSAASTTSSGAPAGATLSRSGSSRRMKSWNTAVSARSPRGEIELAQVDAVDLDRAAAGRTAGTAAWPASSCRRRSGRRSRATSRREWSGRSLRAPGAPPGYANVTSRKRISRAGRPSAATAARTASAPAGAIAGSRRSTAATGAAAPSSAQLKPAERDQRGADRALREHDEPAEVEAAARAGATPATRTRRRWRRCTSSRLQASGRSRSRVACVLQLVQPSCAARRSARSSSRPGRTAAAPCWRADRRPAGRRSRRRAGRSRTSSVLRSRQTALSRSSQCVASHAPASTSGAHHA